MASQTRKELNTNTTPCKSWSTKELLYLVSSVKQLGDKNWKAVSQSLKSSLHEESRKPRDWYSKKSCATQYVDLLENLDTLEEEESSKFNEEFIIKKLTEQRIQEIKEVLAAQKREYLRLKKEVKLIKNATISKEKLEKMYRKLEMEELNHQKYKGCLTKREKKVVKNPQSLNFAITKKPTSSDCHNILNPTSTEKKYETDGGGRSNILKSLLNPNLIKTLSAQLPHLVPGANADAALKGSSVEVPNISMFLPGTSKRQTITLPTLKPLAKTMNVPQQNVNLKMTPFSAPSHMFDSESTEQTDKVIAKDEIDTTLSKDEINDMFEDFEEFIKREILDNPQVLDPRTSGDIGSLISQPPLVSEKQEIRNDPVNISLSDSKECVINIENVDVSKFNIAEIIGVSIESLSLRESKKVESKSVIEVEAETSLMSSEESRKGKAETVPEIVEDVEESVKEYPKGSVKEDTEKSAKDDAKENHLQVLIDSHLEKSELITEKKKSSEKKITNDPKEADCNKSEDQMAQILANITGDQPSTEVLSLFSHDPLSTEDTLKTQDICLILSEEKTLPSLDKKEKEDEEISMIEPVADNVESSSSKKVVAIIKENIAEDEKEKLEKVNEKSKEVVNLEIENSEKGFYFANITSNAEIAKDDLKNLELQEEIKESDPLKGTDELPSEEDLIKDKEIKQELIIKEEYYFYESISTDEELMKEEEDVSGSEGDLTKEELSELCKEQLKKMYSEGHSYSENSQSEMEGSNENAKRKAWKKGIMVVFDKLEAHKYSWIFHKPVNEEKAPNYYSIILRPMDMTTIKKNIDNGKITSSEHFQRDVMLMYQNALMYNKRDSFEYKAALTIWKEFLKHMQILLQLTGEWSFEREIGNT